MTPEDSFVARGTNTVEWLALRLSAEPDDVVGGRSLKCRTKDGRFV
jgi:hypothetical protein